MEESCLEEVLLGRWSRWRSLAFGRSVIVLTLVAEGASAGEELATGLRCCGQCGYLDQLLRQRILEVPHRSRQRLRVCQHVAVTCHEVGFDIWTGVVDEGVV